MTIGAGKYDDLCTIVMEKSEAEAVLVVVLSGNKGHGFSMQMLRPELVKMVPDLLEDVAKQIRSDGSAPGF